MKLSEGRWERLGELGEMEGHQQGDQAPQERLGLAQDLSKIYPRPWDKCVLCTSPAVEEEQRIKRACAVVVGVNFQ